MILDYFSRLLMPPRCSDCLIEVHEYDSLCAKCWKKYKFISDNICKICGTPFDIDSEDFDICLNCTKDKPKYNKSRSLIKFDDKSKKLIHRFKYYDNTNLSRLFAKMLYSKYKNIINESDIITCVPMHKMKRIFRLYNQSQILSNDIAKLAKIRFIPDLLIKVKNNKSQTYLSKSERKKNLSNTIIYNDKYKIENKNILLIDDVITTGETINYISKILISKKPNNINIISIAKRCL